MAFLFHHIPLLAQVHLSKSKRGACIEFESKSGPGVGAQQFHYSPLEEPKGIAMAAEGNGKARATKSQSTDLPVKPAVLVELGVNKYVQICVWRLRPKRDPRTREEDSTRGG